MLIALYQKTLKELQRIPARSAYRQEMEKAVRFQLGVAQTVQTNAEIEDAVGMGQVEELIQHTQEELQVIDMMADWKPWDAAELDESVRAAEEAQFPEEKAERLALEAAEKERLAAAKAAEAEKAAK